MKKRIVTIIWLTLAVFITACGSATKTAQQDKGLKIVTSFYPIYAMVKEVSGDINDVRMIQSSQGIHSFEPSAADIQAIYDADVFFYHSPILESWAGRLNPVETKSDVILVEASKGLALQRVAGLEDVEVSEGINEATLYDPHTWLDPVLVADEVDRIAAELSRIDPENESSYKERAAEMRRQAEALTEKYQGIFRKCSKKTFVTQHTAFAYTASRFGIEQLGILGVAEEEPNPRQLAELKDFIEEYDVETIFVERGSSDKMAQTLKSSTGVNLKILEPLEADPQNNRSFLENLEYNLSVLAKELK